MYISELEIEGYKNCNKKSSITFNPGLNILVGENASGKTTIIDAIRMILRDSEQAYIVEDDFYKSFEKDEQRSNIHIDLKIKKLTPEEKITFLSWCNADFNAELHLEIEKDPNPKGYFKKNIWGGKSKASAFEEETYDFIDTIYLPALRNAEEKLTNGKKSRLALLLKHQYRDDTRKEQLVESFSNFNRSIIVNENGKYNEIEQAKNDINSAIEDSMGNVFGQSINLQFSETSFSSILQNIKMVFFPHLGELDEKKFRDIAINSLGYNNLLYIATVFAELEVVNQNHSLFTVLLIEEPEAHLHPQIQSKLIKYLQKMVTKKNLQIIITTHSAVIASSVGVDTIIYIKGTSEGILSKRMSEFGLDDSIKGYLNRWMDITKSTLLFSKGIILVEGICEAMLMPAFAKLVLAEYNKDQTYKISSSLEEAGVSVININGINFKYFFPLFYDPNNLDNERLPIRCSGVTDKDPRAKEEINDEGKKIKIEQYPIESEEIVGGNEVISLVEQLKFTEQARLFVASLKTFEYDLAMEGNFALMADVIKDGWQKGDENKTGVKSECKKIKEKANKYDNDEDRRKDAKYIYEHIDNVELGKGVFSQLLLEKLEQGNEIIIPNYIKRAIIWACGGIEE